MLFPLGPLSWAEVSKNVWETNNNNKNNKQKSSEYVSVIKRRGKTNNPHPRSPLISERIQQESILYVLYMLFLSSAVSLWSVLRSEVSVWLLIASRTARSTVIKPSYGWPGARSHSSSEEVFLNRKSWYTCVYINARRMFISANWKLTWIVLTKKKQKTKKPQPFAFEVALAWLLSAGSALV